MESELFDWSGWDQVDTAAFQYYDCQLKNQKMIDAVAGRKIVCITINYAESVDNVVIYTECEQKITFTARLVLE